MLNKCSLTDELFILHSPTQSSLIYFCALIEWRISVSLFLPKTLDMTQI